MAAAITVLPAQPKVGDSIDINGSGFTPGANLELAVGEAGLTLLIKVGPSGDFKADKVMKWTPTRAGIFTVAANDGTNTAKATMQIWTT